MRSLPENGSFDEGRFDEALEALERANSFFRSRKLSAVTL